MSPAKSSVQQRAARMALAAKSGEVPVRSLKGAAKQMHHSMTERQLKELAAKGKK